MATVADTKLHNGDRMTREEFHGLYSELPESFKAELIGGIVYVASPLKLRHGTNHLPLGTLFFTYEAQTTGVQSGDNTTILLGELGEPQPDLFLRILPEFGGQSSTTEDDYVAGAPELIAEIAHSSRAIDLHAKRDDYVRYGVLEYLVLNLQDSRLHWFDLKTGNPLQADKDGIMRIASFPGLWIDEQALLEKNHSKMMTVLDQGLASAEHDEFVQRLADAQTGRST